MASVGVISSLPPYPSKQTRRNLAPSQLATLHKTIASSLTQILALPPHKRNSPSSKTFLETYVKDAAQNELDALIPGSAFSPLTPDERHIRANVLRMSEKLAMEPDGMEIQTLVDLSIIYGRTHTASMKAVFVAAVRNNPSHVTTGANDLVDAVTLLFTSLQGNRGAPTDTTDASPTLHALRKTAYLLASLLRVSPPELIRPFARSKPMAIALASAYDPALVAVLQSYDGMQHILSQISSSSSLANKPDTWERVWLETKVDLIDSFHILFQTLLSDMISARDGQVAIEAERTFNIIFALIEHQQLFPVATSSHPSIAFLNRPLLHDYQCTYDLSRMLASSFRHASERDARLDLIESTLQEIDQPRDTLGGQIAKEPGALKLLLQSSGLHCRPDAAQRSVKGKARQELVPTAPELAVDQVRLGEQLSHIQDMLPHVPVSHIKALLLSHQHSFYMDVERVVDLLLDGSAPSEVDLQGSNQLRTETVDAAISVNERRNIFDEEEMNLNNLRFGKLPEDDVSLNDRAAIEAMKADILRRVEAMASDEEDDPNSGEKAATIAYEEELDKFESNIRVIGDGEESGGDSDDDQINEPDGLDDTKQSPETILELAYIQDVKLFNRDGNTRRSKARADLKVQTGWSDEQIEGWKIMLERNPHKDKILRKHEFSGNKPLPETQSITDVPSNSQGQSGRNRGPDRGRARGGHASGSGGRDRGWKEKNKASRANHHRKQGHDKKMAHAGPSL